MRVLALDAATRHVSVAVLSASDADPVVHVPADDERASVILPALVERSLAGLRLEEFDLIAAVRGPGSFTGIRVGLAFASGLAVASGVPAVGLETTRVTALAAGVVGRVAVVVEGGMGRVFAAVHDVDAHGAVRAVVPVRDATVDEAVRLGAEAPTRIVLDDAAGLEVLAAAGFRRLGTPLAGAAARLVAGPSRSEAEEPLEPLYLRAPAIRPTRPRG